MVEPDSLPSDIQANKPTQTNNNDAGFFFGCVTLCYENSVLCNWDGIILDMRCLISENGGRARE